MYEMFYEMKHTPFTRSIPTDMLCKTHQNAEILDRLEYTAIHQKFTLLVGEPGTGKTSTLRHLKDRLPEDKYMVIYISDSRLKPLRHQPGLYPIPDLWFADEADLH